MPELTEEQKLEVADKIKSRVPYSTLSEMYDISKSTIAKIKKQYIEQSEQERLERKAKPKEYKPMSVEQKKILSKKAATRHAIQKAEFFVNGILDSFRSIEYAVENLVEINTKMKEDSEVIVPKLEELVSLIRDGKVGITDPEQVIELVKQIYRTIQTISNEFSRAGVRIAAIKELRGFVSENNKILERIGDIKEIHRILTIFFNSLNLLDEHDYRQIKKFILDKDPTLANLFSRWEETEFQEIGYDGTGNNNEQK